MGQISSTNGSHRNERIGELLSQLEPEHQLEGIFGNDDDGNSPVVNEAKLRRIAESLLRNSTTRLEKFLSLSVESADCINEKKFDEAYGLLVKQMELGEQANFASILIDYYQVLVSTFEFEKAKKVKSELFIILEKNFQSTPKDCELLADRCMKNNDSVKAILFYQAGEILHTKKVDSDEIINCLQGCALGLKLAANSLIKKRPDLRPVVANEVVPAIRRCYDKLSSMFGAKSKSMVLVRSLCLHHIETTELLAKDNMVREYTLREGVQLMEKRFGHEAAKHHLYSAHLNNLAVVCMTNEKPEEAIEIFEKAIESRKLAEDYATEEERKSDLQASTEGLKKAHEMLEYRDKDEKL